MSFIFLNLVQANEIQDEPSLNDLLKQIEKKLSAKPEKKQINDEIANKSIAAENKEKNIESPLDELHANTSLGLIERIAVGEDLFFSTTISNIILGDIFAIKSKLDIKIGLINLIEVLDFPIEVNLEQVTAAGWFIATNKTFQLRLIAETNEIEVKVNDQTYSIKQDQYTILADDIYIESSDFSRWFGIYFELNYQDLEAKITSRHSLPIQERLARQNQDIHSAELSPLPTLPWKESPFQLISSPLIDTQIYTLTTDQISSTGYSVVGGHDLAYYNAEYFISGNNEEAVRNGTLTLSKTSTKSDLLGPLNATQYSFGDVTPVKTGVSGTRQQSAGVTFNNSPIGKIVENDEISLAGQIQVGWDVELYRNGVLIDQRISVISGRYEFNDIELFFGQNKLELIFYGKQGQVETEVKEIYIDGNAVEEGEYYYSASVTDTGNSLFAFNDQIKTSAGLLLSSSFVMGLSKNISTTIYQSYQEYDDRDNLAIYGIEGNFTLFDSMLVGGSAEQTSEDESIYQINARTEVLSQAISASFTTGENLLDDFNIDEENQSQTSKNKQITIDMSGLLFNHKRYSLNYQNAWNYTQTGSENTIQQFRNSTSLNTPLANFNNQISWLNSEFKSNEQVITENDSVLGSIRMQRGFGGMFFRFTSSYDLKPTKEFTQHSASVSWLLADDIQSEIDFNYQPETERWTTSLGLNWRKDQFNFQTDFRRSSDDTWRISLFFNFSFGYEAKTDSVHLSNRSLSNRGAMAVRVFEDENINGRFDEGERLIDGAKVIGIQNRKKSVTDETGVALLQSMQNHKTTDIVLDRDSLPDPFLVPSIEGISITPRAGHIASLDFPVVMAGEIEGTIYIRSSDGEEKVASYAIVYLLDEADEVIATTRTEFDGYYLFVDLLPGNYHLSIDKKYLKRSKLRNPKEIELVLADAGEILNGSDLILSELEFYKGYAVLSNSFTSLKVLKAYWYLVRKQFKGKLKAKVFFMQNDGDKKYQLYLGFHEQENAALEACETLKAENIKCRVEAFEFDQ